MCTCYFYTVFFQCDNGVLLRACRVSGAFGFDFVEILSVKSGKLHQMFAVLLQMLGMRAFSLRRVRAEDRQARRSDIMQGENGSAFED